MRTRRRATIKDLRLAIDCLPRETRQAMLDGIRSQPIIAGAYRDQGGVCPMMAAHRAGARSDLVSFARAWDRFVFRETRTVAVRFATERELRILATNLTASLIADGGRVPDLGAAIADHRRLVARRTAVRAAATALVSDSGIDLRGLLEVGGQDRTGELAAAGGWAWTPVFRSYDDYRRTLASLQAEPPARDPGRYRAPTS